MNYPQKFILFSFFLTFVSMSGSTAVADDHVASVSSELVVGGPLWESSAIPVCWETREDEGNFTSRTRRLVEMAIADSWEAASNVDFTGWNECPHPAFVTSGAGIRRTFDGVRIKAADEWPHAKNLGSNLRGVQNGIVLNFDFVELIRDSEVWSSSSCDDSPTQRDMCIVNIAVHEFGHALGFAHEHNRDDRTTCEIDPQGSAVIRFLTRYDPNSVMNYCGGRSLTDLDILGVRMAYGPPMENIPALVYIEGSNFIVDHETFEPNETGGEHFVRVIPTGPRISDSTDSIITCVGNEVRLEATFNAMFPRSARRPSLDVTARLFEGASGNCYSTNEMEDEDQQLVELHMDHVTKIGFRLKNENVEGDDEGTLNMVARSLLPLGSVEASSGLCLDVHAPDRRNNGARVQVWECNERIQQRWEFIPFSDESGWGSLISASGKCLDVHKPDLGTNGGRVQTWDCNGAQQQTWRFDAGEIRSKGGLCLDVHAPDRSTNGGKVQVWQCNSRPQQKWDILQSTSMSPDADHFAIRSEAGLCLDVHAPEIATNGGKVQVWECNGQPQQSWRPVSVNGSNIWAEIVNEAGHCLDVHAPSARSNGAKVQAWQCNQAPQQQWMKQGNRLINQAGGLCLDVHASDLRNNGGRVQVWECNGAIQQAWNYVERGFE